MRASIIIPTHNRPEYLGDCLRSAEVAIRSHGEIIVVDDGSNPPAKLPNNSLDCVKISRLPISKEASAARNFGVAQASGGLVFFLDDDDEMNPNYIEHILQLHSQGNPARFGFANYTIRGETDIKGKVSKSRLIYKESLRKRVAGLGMGFWIERVLFESLGGLNTNMLIDEDTDLCVRLASRGIAPWADIMPATKIRRDNAQRLTNATKTEEVCRRII